MNNENLKRIEQLKHNEELLFKVLSYLSELLVKNNVGYTEEIEIYKKYLGMSEEDLEYLGLRDYELERELNIFEGVDYENLAKNE